MTSVRTTNAGAHGQCVQPARARSRYLSLLQIIAALGIIAFHIGIRHSHAGWIFVELFFAIAGMNMATAIVGDRSIGAYALMRIRRFGPMVLIIWGATLLFVALGHGTDGMLWFILTAPLFAQNLSLVFFHYEMPNDWVFGPLWFVGALLQLQLVLFLVRGVLATVRPAMLVAVSVTAGISFRLLAASIIDADPGTLSVFQADVLYCLPFTHLEAIVLGLLVGRGALPRLGRLLPWFVAAVVGLETVVGLGFPLRFNFSHVWGYTILAFAAASVCARNAWPSVVVERMVMPRWVDAMVSKLAELSYSAYAFHGLIMATGMNVALLALFNPRRVSLLLFVLTAVQSFVIAGGLAAAMRVLKERAVPILRPAHARPD